MNNNTFERIVEDSLEMCKAVLIKKSGEYSSDDDKLHNFNKAKDLMRCNTKEFALLGMLNKHLVSVVDMIEKFEKTGELPTSNMIDEKIGDSINYFILLKACFYDDMIKKEKDKDKDIHVRKKAVVETIRKKIQPIYDWCNENMSVDPFQKTFYKEAEKSDAESDIPFLQTMSKILTELDLPKVVKNKNNVFIGLAAIRDEILRGLFDDIENLKDGGYFETIKEEERAMSLTEILEKNQGAIANSLYQNPRKRLVVENLRKILKPLFVWLTDNNEFVDYEKIKKILNRAEFDPDNVPDDEFIKNVVVAAEKILLPIKMKETRDNIITEIMQTMLLSKYKCGDGVYVIDKEGCKWIPVHKIQIYNIGLYLDTKEIYYESIYGEIGYEKDCFKTLEEAQRECDKRNNKI